MYFNPTVLPLCGPLAVRWYGLMIVLGLLAFLFLLMRDSKRKKYLPEALVHEALLYGIISGVLGGRFLFFITEAAHGDGFIDFFKIWEPGFSLLGAVIAIPLVVTLYVKSKGVSALLFFDIISVYVPLLQAISRLGCFGAGCCYGKEVLRTSWWSVLYEHPEALAPLHVALHPAQLYSAGASLLLCIGLYSISRSFKLPRGSIFALYLIGEGLARFSVDFFRSRSAYEMGHGLHFFGIYITYYQCISLGVVGVGALMLLVRFWFHDKKELV